LQKGGQKAEGGGGRNKKRYVFVSENGRSWETSRQIDRKENQILRGNGGKRGNDDEEKESTVKVNS